MKKLYTIVLIAIMCCSSLVVAQSQSAEELARAYIDARNTYDIETTKSLLADDVEIIEIGDAYTVEEVGAFLAYAEMQDMRWEVEDCSSSDNGSSTIVCSFLLANSISDALEIAPIPGGTYAFETADGKISKVVLELPLKVWQPNVFAMMIAFIRANHFEDFRTLLPEGFPSNVSDEGLAMWRSYTDEFVEVVGKARANPTSTETEQIGFDFLTARDNLNAEAMAALMADEVECFDNGRQCNIEGYTELFGWYESLNWNWTAKSCDDIGESNGVTKILCISELSNDVSRGLDNGNYNMGWGLEVKDNKIVGVFPEWNRFFVNENLTPLKQYILKNHNEDYANMYDPQGGNLVRGKENQDLLKTYITEFIATQ